MNLPPALKVDSVLASWRLLDTSNGAFQLELCAGVFPEGLRQALESAINRVERYVPAVVDQRILNAKEGACLMGLDCEVGMDGNLYVPPRCFVP
jgi:hypothetical protein